MQGWSNKPRARFVKKTTPEQLLCGQGWRAQDRDGPDGSTWFKRQDGLDQTSWANTYQWPWGPLPRKDPRASHCKESHQFQGNSGSIRSFSLFFPSKTGDTWERWLHKVRADLLDLVLDEIAVLTLSSPQPHQVDNYPHFTGESGEARATE